MIGGLFLVFTKFFKEAIACSRSMLLIDIISFLLLVE